MEVSDFEVVTAYGTTIMVSRDRAVALARAVSLAEEFPGCEVYEVIPRKPLRRRIFPHAPPLRLVGAI